MRVSEWGLDIVVIYIFYDHSAVRSVYRYAIQLKARFQMISPNLQTSQNRLYSGKRSSECFE